MKLKNAHKTLAAVFTVALTAIGFTADAENIPGVAEQPASYFYTGKPYDKDLGEYTFAARNYNPQINRWTSADPSGFPDGANNSIYLSNSILSSVDLLGLKRVTATGSYVITATWTESNDFTMGYSGFSAAFPLQVSVSINPGHPWQLIDGTYSTTQTSGTLPQNAELPEILVQTGWSWVDDSIVNYTNLQYGATTYGSPYTVSLGGAGSISIDQTRRDGSKSVTFGWTRIYENSAIE